jgi:hypothetical protein
MRSASIEIDQQFLFELLSLEGLNANIVSAEAYNRFNQQTLRLSILGDDERLPDDQNYPKCMVRFKVIETHFEKV